MNREDIVGILIILTIFVGIVWGTFVLMDYQCVSRWPASFKADYTVITGCTIETEDGRIPDDNYRVL